jgi:hypothetical protein
MQTSERHIEQQHIISSTVKSKKINGWPHTRPTPQRILLAFGLWACIL